MSTGKSAATRSAKRQRAAIAEQKRKEDLRLAEAKSELAEQKLGDKNRVRRGRSLLVNTSAQGLRQSTGGA